MDVEMPEMNGIEATQAIRAMPPPKCSIPIIALTAHTGEEERNIRIAAGMDDYVSKPINFDILFTKLSTLAAKKAG
jgi:CheY-like chemotaxis protein